MSSVEAKRTIAQNNAKDPPMRDLALKICGCLGLALLIAGCASQPAVVDSAALWPFEQMTIRTTVGAVRGYFYRPQDAAVRLVVALQTSPCSATDPRDQPILSTNGAVWDRFKYDSLFFQFERPGGSSDEHSVIVTCERADRTANDWQEAVVDSLRAVRKREHLDGVPTTYLGVGNGATLAIHTALNDPESKSVVLMSATFSSQERAQVSQMLAQSPTRRRPTILFIHGAEDERTPVEQIASVADTFSAQHVQTKLIVFDKVGADFGLNSTDGDCFDLVAAKLAEYVRFDQRGTARPVRVGCEMQTGPDDGSIIQRIERL